ncbi:MAG: aminopeptidase P family protein [Candidatus Omnitrophica bacterium]|nr:aminopeptidase P family protein [Candidatus Omnitrophota bacterium]
MTKIADHRSVLMIASSEADANLYYATRFIAPDDFVFVQTGGKRHLLMSDLEVDRAKSQAQVDHVHSTSLLAAEYRKKYDKKPSYLDLIEEFLKSQRVQNFEVPGNFPAQYLDPLRARGFQIEIKGDPFFEERTVKSPEEIRAIAQAIKNVEIAVGLAIQTLKKSVIRKGKLYFHGERLTSESIKKIINVKLMELDCIAAHSIVACGNHAVDPHDQGSGPLYAHQSIIMDIFPRDSKSRYFADFTRTVVRGKASEKLKKMYAAVKEGQDIAFKKIREGVDGNEIHGTIQSRFESLGFKTGVMNGRMQGFFHGTGHGLGLDIHEEPRISLGKSILKAGHVVTVEPGLYYEDAGGVRLEDVVVVKKTSCVNLTRFPKFLEL